jgi:hypothetical protein
MSFFRFPKFSYDTLSLNKVNYWYSKKWIIPSALIFLLVVFLLSLFVPPMQSPDEYNHLERAYLLSKGELRLERSDDKLLGIILNLRNPLVFQTKT